MAHNMLSNNVIADVGVAFFSAWMLASNNQEMNHEARNQRAATLN